MIETGGRWFKCQLESKSMFTGRSYRYRYQSIPTRTHYLALLLYPSKNFSVICFVHSHRLTLSTHYYDNATPKYDDLDTMFEIFTAALSFFVTEFDGCSPRLYAKRRRSTGVVYAGRWRQPCRILRFGFWRLLNRNHSERNHVLE